MYLSSCDCDYRVLTLCSCPDHLTTAALFLHRLPGYYSDPSGLLYQLASASFPLNKHLYYYHPRLCREFGLPQPRNTMHAHLLGQKAAFMCTLADEGIEV